jgi:predicted transcriptional regulator
MTPLQDRLYAAVPNGWETARQIAERAEVSHAYAAHTLEGLACKGLVERNGRGRRPTLWRRIPADNT